MGKWSDCRKVSSIDEGSEAMRTFVDNSLEEVQGRKGQYQPPQSIPIGEPEILKPCEVFHISPPVEFMGSTALSTPSRYYTR
jgi:hypothetical protein